MRRAVPAALALLAFALTAGLCRVDPGAEYRAVGLALLDEADAVRAARKDGRPAFDSPALPGPVATTLLSTRWLGDDDLGAATLGAAVLTGLTAAAVALTGWLIGGLAGGLGALAALLLLPATLYHGRTVGPEATVALSWALLLLASAAGTRGVIGALLGSLAMALALGSAHESVWLLIAWAVTVWLTSSSRATGAPHRGEVPLAPVPVAALIPIVAGPVLLVALWPYLGDETGKRLVAVMYDPLKAQHPPILIAGHVHDQSFARGPGVADGWLMLLIRLPLVLAALATVGATGILRGIRRLDPTLRRGGFAVLGAATLVLIIGLNGSPWYAGIDGVATLGPFVAVLAGAGVARVYEALRALWPTDYPLRPAAAAALLAALALGPAAIEQARSFGREPSYHSALIGGVGGAASLGFEVRPLPALPEGMIRWMNEHLPRGAAVAVEPAGDRYRGLLDGLKRRGLLRADLESASPYHATHVLRPAHPAWPLYRDAAAHPGTPLVTWENGGATLMALYRY